MNLFTLLWCRGLAGLSRLSRFDIHTFNYEYVMSRYSINELSGIGFCHGISGFCYSMLNLNCFDALCTDEMYSLLYDYLKENKFDDDAFLLNGVGGLLLVLKSLKHRKKFIGDALSLF